jgi:hypothetical protein
MPARIAIMLVVMAAVVASKAPAVLAQSAPQSDVPRQTTRTSWIERLEVGLSRSITRQALLQCLSFEPPRVLSARATDRNTRPLQSPLPDPLHTRLPPPTC